MVIRGECMTQIIGLTGGIASGKSTVSDMFKAENIPVIDTDLITHKLYQKHSVVYDKIVETFGDDVLFANKDINRKLLGKWIYENQSLRETLNRIVHPHVKKMVYKEIDELSLLNPKVIVIDVPLLFETDFIDMVDKSVVVYVTKALQLERLMDRDQISEAFATSKINAQLPLSEKKKKADYVIDNSQSILQTKKQFNALLEKLGVI